MDGATTEPNWDRSKPWTAPAQRIELYRSAGGWGFSVRSDHAIAHGALRGVDADAPVERAKAAVLEVVEQATNLTYQATWSQPRGSGTGYVADLQIVGLARCGLYA